MKPRCLIQGSASASNVDSLIRFLHDQGVPAPEIHVIDLIDLTALGYADPRARYHQINAADLSELFTDRSIDLLLQDHLLNCAPICHYDAILSEVGRILSSTGLALLHYTDPSRFPIARGNRMKTWLNAERIRQGEPAGHTEDEGKTRSRPSESPANESTSGDDKGASYSWR
jgi:hypothetical protein